jgi:hypothetical protein
LENIGGSVKNKMSCVGWADAFDRYRRLNRQVSGGVFSRLSNNSSDASDYS